MRTAYLDRSYVLGLLLAAGLATTGYGQERARPADDTRNGGVHKMVITVGPNRTVHYFAPGLTSGELSSLRNLERAENDVAFADDLAALRRVYVDSELMLEPYRRSVQLSLYGTSTVSGYGNFLSGSLFAPGGYAYPYYVPYAYPNGYNGFANNFFNGYAGTVAHSLAFGMGDEGVFKNEMVKALAGQASPEYLTAVSRRYDDALARVAANDRLAKGLGLTKSDVRPVAAEPPVTVYLKGGEKIEGRLVRDEADWIGVETDKATVNVRRSEVTRVDQHKK
jgi:hypothetical protein